MSKSKWNFDRTILEQGIEIGKTELSKSSTPISEKIGIEKDIEFFNNMLNQNFSNESDDLHYYEDMYIEEDEEELPFEIIKEEIIEKCKELLFILGSRSLNLIIKLYEDNIFYIPSYLDEYSLSMDEQVEYTIKNYERHAKAFLDKAKELLLSEKPKYIQYTDKKGVSSYVHYSSILNHPFIIVNPNEMNSILNHETEHAIELLKKIDNAEDNYFCEVGAIYFELLFCDLLHEQSNRPFSADFERRVEETAVTISDLYPIFNFINELKKRKFEVNNSEFLSICESYLGISTKYELEYFLFSSLSPAEIDEKIRYVFSHLKAIELREKTIQTGKSSPELLMESLRTPLTYKRLDDKIKVYKKYLSEIERKR